MQQKLTLYVTVGMALLLNVTTYLIAQFVVAIEYL